MNLLEFVRKIPQDRSVDIRPDVAKQVRNFIEQNAVEVGRTYFSPAAYVMNKVCKDTGFVDRRTNRSDASKKLSNSEKDSDYYTNVVNAWAGANKSKRGKPELAQAVFYWFFRHVADPSYFIEIARTIWKKDSELFKRFYYAKEGGGPSDSFESIIGRFRSEEALNNVARFSSEQQRLSATYPDVINFSPAYQLGRTEFRSAKKHLIAKSSKSPAVTMAIYGAGGYGKSSLAQELCNDPDVRKKFSGGIYWLQFGLTDTNDEDAGATRLAEAIDRMFERQYPKAERPAQAEKSGDSEVFRLLGVLLEEHLLIVVDDLWVGWQTGWLSEVPPHVSILITTRVQSVAHRAGTQIPIGRLPDKASYQLLTHGTQNIGEDRQQRLLEVARRLKGWPILLNLANGVFKHKRENDPTDRIDWALSRYEEFLTDDQIDGWDRAETGEGELSKRRKLVGFCIEAGLGAIDPSNSPNILRTLAVFPVDADIPFEVASDFWNEIGEERITRTRGKTLLEHFADFSFFNDFSHQKQTFRLHDEILAYFRGHLKLGQLKELHGKIINAIKRHCTNGWDTLSHTQHYEWRHLLYHFEHAGMTNEADDLRTNFCWLKAKLLAVGPSELQRSFFPISNRLDARVVGQAIHLSLPTLRVRPDSLSHQLFGRLAHEAGAGLQEIAAAARRDPNFWPVPLKPHLRPMGSELVRFVGHSHAVNSAVFDRSGRKIVTASDDCTAQVWETATGATIGKSLRGHDKPVKHASFDSSGQRVVTASDDRTARLWDAETGEPVGRPLTGHAHAVVGACFDSHGKTVITASIDGTIRLWDAETNSIIGEPLQESNGALLSAIFESNGSEITACSNKGTICLLNAETGAPIARPLENLGLKSGFIAFRPSSHRAVTMSKDGSAQVWDTKYAKPIGKPLRSDEGTILSASFDLNACRVLTASNDCTARLWETNTGEMVGKPLEGHNHVVLSAVFSPDNLRVVTSSRDRTARLWEVPASSDRYYTNEIGSLAPNHFFDPLGRWIFHVLSKNSACLRDTRTGARVVKFVGTSTSLISTVAFDPLGKRLLTASYLGGTYLWDIKTGDLIANLTGHNSAVTRAAFDPNGCKLATGSFDKTCRLWDATTGAPIGALEGHAADVCSIALDRNGSKILTAVGDGTAQIWNPETSARIGTRLEGHKEKIVEAAFDPSGRSIVTASEDCTARQWDSATGAPIGKSLVGHERTVTRVTYDPLGHEILTASYDLSIRRWNAATGEPIGQPLSGHSDVVNMTSFSPDGQFVLSASQDCTVRIWETKTNATLATIDFDSPPVMIAWHHRHFSVGLRTGETVFFEIDRTSGAKV